MQTSFPNLPYMNYGDAVLDPSGIHSAAKAGPRTYPRTDLQTLEPWTDFPKDVHEVIMSATTRARLPFTSFHIDGATWDTFVENEEKLRNHAWSALIVPIVFVLRKLGVNGRFRTPGGGNNAIIGDPDLSFVMSTTPDQAPPHPKTIVEYKTWWAVDLANLVSDFRGAHRDNQTLHALQQTYGYMTFNNNRFGILTNWKQTVFLRRAETPDRKTLQYYLINLGDGQSISMLKAWVGIVLLAEDNWFYASPTPSSPPPNRNFTKTLFGLRKKTKAVQDAEKYRMQPINDSDAAYKCIAIDFRLCHFDLSSARRGANGCVVKGRFLSPVPLGRDQQVICKVVDVTRYTNTADLLDDEACAYAALKGLQGKVIPTVYGYYEVWGILRFLALEPVGNAISEDEQIDQTLRTKMKAALQCIHDAGFIHLDIERRNFCRTDRGDVFLVDLESCHRCEDQSQLRDEMNRVDEL